MLNEDILESIIIKDKEDLNKLWQSGKAPWMVWDERKERGY